MLFLLVSISLETHATSKAQLNTEQRQMERHRFNNSLVFPIIPHNEMGFIGCIWGRPPDNISSISTCEYAWESSRLQVALTSRYSRENFAYVWSSGYETNYSNPLVAINNSINPLTSTVAVLPHGTAIKHPVPDWVKPSLVIFDIRSLMLSPIGDSLMIACSNIGNYSR